jgi:putative oxidoreductase
MRHHFVRLPASRMNHVRGHWAAAIEGVAAASSAYVLSLLRIVAGILFICHGLQKLVGFPVPMPGPHVSLASLLGVAGLVETLGGALIIAGLFTRLVAFVLSGEMAVAYFMQHARGGAWPIANGGELAVLYSFIFLCFAAVGGGPWSLDSLFGQQENGGSRS